MLSNVTLEYLDAYYEIIGEMVHAINTAHKDTISGSFISGIISIMNAASRVSQNILKYTTNIQIQNIAESIIYELGEICDEIKKIPENCLDLRNSDRDTILYKRRTNSAICLMFSKAENAPIANNLNYNFLHEINILYASMIEICAIFLNFSSCRPLYDTAEKLINKLKKRKKEINGRF